MDLRHIKRYLADYYNNARWGDLIGSHYVCLYNASGLSVEWHVMSNYILLQTTDKKFVISSDYPCNDNKKRDILNALELIQEVKWNKVGNPIKTELLTHLYQLHQLDGSLTKSASKSI